MVIAIFNLCTATRLGFDENIVARGKTTVSWNWVGTKRRNFDKFCPNALYVISSVLLSVCWMRWRARSISIRQQSWFDPYLLKLASFKFLYRFGSPEGLLTTSSNTFLAAGHA